VTADKNRGIKCNSWVINIATLTKQNKTQKIKKQ